MTKLDTIYNNLTLNFYMDLEIKSSLKYMPKEMIYDTDDGSYSRLKFFNIPDKEHLVYQVNEIIEQLKFINGHVSLENDYEQNKVTGILSQTIGILKKFLTLDIDSVIEKLKDNTISIINVDDYITDDVNVSIRLYLSNDLYNYMFRLSKNAYNQLEKNARSHYPNEYNVSKSYAIEKLLQDMTEYLKE